MTKEEILDNYLKDKCCSRKFDYIDDYVVYGLIENAMQEYADQQTKELQERVEELKQIGVESIKIAEDLSSLKKKYENRVDQLQSRIDELQKGNEWVSVEDRLPLATETGNFDGKRSDIYLGKYKDGTYCLFRIYTGFIDGSHFTDYYDENDNSIYPPTYYKPIH